APATRHTQEGRSTTFTPPLTRITGKDTTTKGPGNGLKARNGWDWRLLAAEAVKTTPSERWSSLPASAKAEPRQLTTNSESSENWMDSGISPTGRWSEQNRSSATRSAGTILVPAA